MSNPDINGSKRASGDLHPMDDSPSIEHETDAVETEKSDVQDSMIPTDQEALQHHVNDQLEAYMSDYKAKIKHIFKEFIIFQSEAQKVQKLWAPILESQQKEQERLDAVQANVQKKMMSIPWMGQGAQTE